MGQKLFIDRGLIFFKRVDRGPNCIKKKVFCGPKIFKCSNEHKNNILLNKISSSRALVMITYSIKSLYQKIVLLLFSKIYFLS